MGLLDKLGLPPPRVPAAAHTDADASGPEGGLPLDPFAGGASGGRVLDLDTMSFPVTIAGFTREMIRTRIRDDREGIMLALGDVQHRLTACEAAERTLAPKAAVVEKAMKTAPEKLVAEIHANTGEKTRRMGRDAANARGVLGLSDTVQKLLNDLLTNARRQLELARKSLDAQNKIEQAAELRVKAAEIAAAFDLLQGLFEKAQDFEITDATLAGAGVSLLTWGLKAAAGADRLTEQAQALEDAAKKLQVEVVREQFEAAAQHAKALADRVRDARKDLQANAKNYNQQRGEVERSFDAGSKGAFRFGAFDEALKLGEASLAALEEAAAQARGTARRLMLLDQWLAGMLRVEGKCLSHHSKAPKQGAIFEPDPRRVYEETTAMKAEVRQAAAALAPLRKRADNQTLGIQIETGEVNRRQERWLAYYGAAQTALFTAPEPDPTAGKKRR